MTLKPLMIALVCLGLPGIAYAADPLAPAPPPAGPPPSPFYSQLTLSAATDYIPRGLSLNSHDPALEGKLEVGYNYKLYGIARVVSASFAGGTREIDLAAGFRPVLSPYVLDFGFVQYVFDGAYPNFSELYGAFVWPTAAGTAGNRWSATAEGFWSTDGGGYYVEGDVGYVLIGQQQGPNLVPKLVASARIAHATRPFTYTTWGGALTYTFAPGLTGELRYSTTNLTDAECGSNICDSRVMFKLAYQTSLGAIFDPHRH